MTVSMPEYLAFNIILDDIVFPDGQTRMGVLGGGGPQAAFGMRLWADSVGLVASVGPDLPEAVPAWFQACGIALSGLRQSSQPTPRAWQALEADGRRTQVWRVPGAALAEHLDVGRLLSGFASQPWRGLHLGIHPLEPAPQPLFNDLRAAPGLFSLETFKPAERLADSAELRQLAGLGDILSLNLLEARSLLGDLEPLSLLTALLDSGAPVAILRLGSEGCLAAQQGSHQAVRIPAVPTRVVDTVGAGNAFCGAFLVAWDQTHDLVHAAACGSAAASFLVEQVGLPAWNQFTRSEAERRMRFAREQARFIQLTQGEISK